MPTAQRLYRSALVLVTAVAGIVVLDRALDACLFQTALAKTIVSIQQPATLLAKLDYLRRQPGYKVVVLGDSLIHGHALAEHGDPLWREHNLTALLEDRLRRERPGQSVTVLNLGLNGAVPADLEQLARLVLACRVDLVIFDTHLRQFSADFSAPDQQLSRPWLKQLHLDESGHPRQDGPDAGWFAAAENVLGGTLHQHLALYRIRGLVQESILDSSLADTVQGWRKRLNPAPPPAQPSSSDDLVLDQTTARLLEIGKRLRTVNLSTDNPQRQALERLLETLRQRRQPTVVFYAQENPDQILSVMKKSRYRQLRQELDAIITTYTGDHLRYLSPLARLDPTQYLDFIHVNHQGYGIMSDRLWETIRTLPQ
jgi:lysophospholipase L1-like esterase